MGLTDTVGNEPDVVFSQGLNAPKSLGPKPTADQIQRLVDKVLQVAKNIVPVSIIGNPSQIHGVNVPVGAKPTGAVIGGRIYLFSDNIGSMGEAYVTLFHELFHLRLGQSVNQGHQVFSPGLLSPTSNVPKPTKKQVQALVDLFQKLSKLPLPVTVVNRPSDVDGLPIHIPIGAKPMGGVFAREIYIFTDNLHSTGVAILTVFHALFHRGSKVRFDRLHCF